MRGAVVSVAEAASLHPRAKGRPPLRAPNHPIGPVTFRAVSSTASSARAMFRVTASGHLRVDVKASGPHRAAETADAIPLLRRLVRPAWIVPAVSRRHRRNEKALRRGRRKEKVRVGGRKAGGSSATSRSRGQPFELLKGLLREAFPFSLESMRVGSALLCSLLPGGGTFLHDRAVDPRLDIEPAAAQ